jgi:hypothetical protein
MDVIVLKQDNEWTIWSVAPVSITHELADIDVGKTTLEAKIECDRLVVKVCEL